MNTPKPTPRSDIVLAHSFDQMEEARASYVAMRHAMTEMSLLDLALKEADLISEGRALIAEFDRAVDAFLGANARLEQLGFWDSKDAAYMPAPDGPAAA